MTRYIHERQDWPGFTWDADRLETLLGQVRHGQGRLLGRMESLGFPLQDEAVLKTITQDVLKSSQIEGEILNPDQVRSSVARRLGLEVAGLVPSSRDVDGVVEMMLDASQHYDRPLTVDRLFGWHAALFPTGRSGMFRITVGEWRKDETGPMQVVSGPPNREVVHFQAPPAEQVGEEMDRFITWFNGNKTTDPVIKAALAHLYFVTIHPFEDGNGRIARAIADMQLARADGSPRRFYSMSSQIEQAKKDYYDILERTQKGDLDVTRWLDWFLSCLQKALIDSNDLLSNILQKAGFWQRHAATALNDRQKYIINKLFDDFFGVLHSAKWAKMTKVSKETAVRDINDLVKKGILRKDEAGGRSTNYVLIR
jgi:Fic family protein